MSKIVRVLQLPDAFDGEWFWYVAERTEPGYEYMSGDYACEQEANADAVTYSLLRGIPVYLCDDPDGSLGKLKQQQAVEREERYMQQEVG